MYAAKDDGRDAVRVFDRLVAMRDGRLPAAARAELGAQVEDALRPSASNSRAVEGAGAQLAEQRPPGARRPAARSVKSSRSVPARAAATPGLRRAAEVGDRDAAERVGDRDALEAEAVAQLAGGDRAGEKAAGFGEKAG